MLHMAAQEGKSEMVQLLIDDYNLDPTARTKVCGQTCRHFEMWVFIFPLFSLSFLSLNVLPAARYNTCDASSRQRSH